MFVRHYNMFVLYKHIIILAKIYIEECSVISNEEMIQFLPSFLTAKISVIITLLIIITGVAIATKLTLILSHVNY